MKTSRQKLFSLVPYHSLYLTLLLPLLSTSCTFIISTDSEENPGNGDSGWYGYSSVSSDGRFITFASKASNFAPGDTNDVEDVFLRDRQNGTTTRINMGYDGSQANERHQFGLDMTSDGSHIVYASEASNLVPDDTNQMVDIFIYNRATGVTEVVSVSSDNVLGDLHSQNCAVSDNGFFVVFESLAHNLAGNDANLGSDIFVRNTLIKQTELVSLSTDGIQGNASSSQPDISGNWLYIVYESKATNLVNDDTNGKQDIFLRNQLNGTTERISIGNDGGEANDDSFAPAISQDGRYIAYVSWASNLVDNDTTSTADVFVYDRINETTELVSIASDGSQRDIGYHKDWYISKPSISDDGRFITFETDGSYVMEDTNDKYDVYRIDRLTHTIMLVSLANNGDLSNGDSRIPVMSTDGRYITFTSSADNLTGNDTNGFLDVFLRVLEPTGL